jgi:serine/threonine-protein kinase HipA
MAAQEEQFRRMLFNVVARNQDDHVKNIAFLMDRSGAWSLSPAFDVMYAYNPAGQWTSRHQMTINGKSDGFEPEDFRACAAIAGLKRGLDRDLLAQVVSAVREWPRFAEEAGVSLSQRDAISRAHRMYLHRALGRKKRSPARGVVQRRVNKRLREN